MPVYRYRLLDPDGVDLGSLVSQQKEWKPGEVLPRPHGELRVIAVVEPETGTDFRAYLVVRAADDPSECSRCGQPNVEVTANGNIFCPDCGHIETIRSSPTPPPGSATI